MPELDPYKTLQVDPEADPEVIQAAYRRLARKYHPDVMPGPDAAAKMVAINSAWSVLENPESRAAHDRERAARAVRETRERRRTTGRAVGRPDDGQGAPEGRDAPRRSA
ncbi:MAG: DnaJ domain-containing protein, partial [Chloroflexota bacterium]|nr:DnaJ domain-containing protein [Chloroflexota bacterium]